MVEPTQHQALISRLFELRDHPEAKVGLLVDLQGVEHGDDPRFTLSLQHYIESWLGDCPREVFRATDRRLLLLAPAAMRGSLEQGAASLIDVLNHHGFGSLHAGVYDLSTDAGGLLERLFPGRGRARTPPVISPVSGSTLGRLLEVERVLTGADVAALLREETVWNLADPAMPRPVLTELAVSLDELETRLDLALREDDWLRHEVAPLLDRGMLRHVARDRGRVARPVSFDLHISSVLDDGFGALARTIPADVRRHLTLELASWEVGLSPMRFAAAARRIRDLGFAVAVDRVPGTALADLDLGGAEVAFVKTMWSSADDFADRLRDGVARFGADRLIVWGTPTAAAVDVGRRSGVALFQGHGANIAAAAAPPAVERRVAAGSDDGAEGDDDDEVAEPDPTARPWSRVLRRFFRLRD